LPDSYSPRDTARYPVLYLLDGNLFFSLLQSMQRFYLSGQEVPEMIIVGVGYPINTVMESMPNRTLDYTPTRDTAFDNMLTKELKMTIKSGGAAAFLQTLKKDILPFIERQYRTSTDKAIAGHSFGALFGAYVLFHEPSIFNRYLLSSISMPWDNNEMLHEEHNYYTKSNRRLNARVFVSVGDKEDNAMQPLMTELVSNMRNHDYAGLEIDDHILEDETHTSAIATALNRGIRYLYKNFRDMNK
jgi:predicted alpha/beta superfamily hydrolase